MTVPPEATLRIAVVQPRLAVGDVDRNLARVADLARDAAREHGPEIIVLPEAITSPTVHSPAMHAVPRAIDGEPYEMLRRLARTCGCWVGGGYLAVNGPRARSVYVIAEPNGATHVHEKEQPDLWEAHYATGGIDDGFASTPRGPVGIVSGLEWLRSSTAQRLAGTVRILLGGACWWAPPGWRALPKSARRHSQERFAALAREAPSRMARTVGAPAAVAHHMGSVTGRTPLVPGLPWPARLAGESVIVERDGRVVARLGTDDEGHVAAEVGLSEPEPLEPVPRQTWLVTRPRELQAASVVHSFHGRVAHRRRERAGSLPWQGRSHALLRAYNPPDLPPDERPERQVVAEPFGVDPIPPASLDARAATR